MRTFFIYDTAYCKAEEDDPKDAVLYFFPAQVHENHYYSLCGQIVGVAKFLKSTFSSPSFITLDQEKFALLWSEKYLFVLGGNVDLPGNLLKQQLSFLCGMFCFYHGSLNTLLKVCKNDRKEFLNRLELAWSRYITFFECFNNLICVPTHPIPLPFVKKYAETVSKANELLRMCQLSASVIAGAVYSNSRVILSQLDSELTSYLTLMSNENAASPVTSAKSPVKNLPPSVELKYVYLSQKAFQNIVRHNHVHLGSCVRVKIDGKTQVLEAPGYCGNITSGSEGDVDSGHCTERVYRRKNLTLNTVKSLSAPAYSEFNFKSQLLCCMMHAEMFNKDVVKCRNRIFEKHVNSKFISEKLKVLEKKTSAQFGMNSKIKMHFCKSGKEAKVDDKVLTFNLLCHEHANAFSDNFMSKSPSLLHLNLSSTCDLEYSCSFCINHRFSNNLSLFSWKSWNSEMNISDCFHHISQERRAIEHTSDANKLKKEKKAKCKIQILKCRTRSDTCVQCTKRSNFHSGHSKRHCGQHTTHDSRSSVSRHQKNHLSYSQNFGDYWKNMESSELEKCLLYVQRCENSMVLLLMNKNYDENIITYLWNCSFTFLKDLEYPSEKKSDLINEADTVNYVLVYDNIRRVLKENPQYQASCFTEKTVKDSVQAIQESFQLNPSIQMFSLLCKNQSIFACQTKQHSAFYLQQDLSSKKSESLCNLNKKAIRRLEKYLNLP